MDSVSKALLMVGAGAAPPAPAGQIVYEGLANGPSSTFSFVVPSGVTSISVVCVAQGTNGTAYTQNAGGNLAYGNNIPVTSGETLTVVVGGGGRESSQSVPSRIARGATDLVLAGCRVANSSSNLNNSGTNLSGGGIGGTTASNGNFSGFGGGGAGGYTGNGGAGRDGNQSGLAGSGGGGGGGGAGQQKFTTVGVTNYELYGGGGGGGGVGLLGEGSSGNGGAAGSGGTSTSATGGTRGVGGSSSPAIATSGQAASTSSAGNGGNGGRYGGGGGGFAYAIGYEIDENNDYNVVFDSAGSVGAGGRGAVRIIWYGDTRLFPSTNTGNV